MGSATTPCHCDKADSEHESHSLRRTASWSTGSSGPVHFARLAKLGAAEFGLSRVTGDRAAAILQQLDPSHVRDGDATHAWPGDVDGTTWTGYRWSAPDDDRDLRSISPVELANLMRDVAEQSAEFEEEPLFREVLARVGARRLTPDVQAHLALALEAALGLGRLRRAGEVLVPVPG